MAITKKDALETLRISWYCFLLHLLCLAWIVGFFSDNLENISPLERMRNGLAAWMEPQALFMMAPYIVGGVIACYIVIVRKKPVFWASTRVLRAIAVWFLASVFAGVMVPLTWLGDIGHGERMMRMLGTQGILEIISGIAGLIIIWLIGTGFLSLPLILLFSFMWKIEKHQNV